MFSTVYDPNHSAKVLNDDLNKILEWAYKWKMLFKKHFGIHLDKKLNFSHHINKNTAKANKGIGLVCKLAHVLPRQSLITIYKSFIQPHFDYGDIIYDQPNNESFFNLIERVQYNAALAITSAIKSTSQPEIYNELSIESLKFRGLFR